MDLYIVEEEFGSFKGDSSATFVPEQHLVGVYDNLVCAEGIACQVATGGAIVNIFSMKLGEVFDREDPSLTTLVRRYNPQHFHESPWVYNRRCAEEFDENLQMIDDQIIPSRTCTNKENPTTLAGLKGEIQ